LLTVTLAIVSAAKGEERIHPAVRAELSKLAPSEHTTVLFLLKQQADVLALDRTLTSRDASRRERHQQVVELLQAEARMSQAPLLAELSLRSYRGEVAGYTPYWIMNLVVVRATRAAIEDLAGRPDIDRVEPSIRLRSMEPMDVRPTGNENSPLRGVGVPPGIRAIHAPEVWRHLGFNGSGTLVGIIDTGVDGSHPALRDRWRGNNGHPWYECWYDAIGSGSQVPIDPNRHGTHVMGTLCGLGAGTSDTIGVAWGAQWIAANAIDQGVGSEFDSDIIGCFQWFADPDGDPETVDDVPDVIENSWGISEYFGGSPPYTDCDSRWWGVIDNCEAAGIVTTWVVGGDGPAPGSVRSPADRATTAYSSFSIGAVDATHSNFPYPIADFSSRGPTGCNVPAPLKMKPEVVAPGVDIYSSVPGGSYETWSGTAMAGPHVAGVVALMRSANPDIEVDRIKEILIATARDEGGTGEDNSYGWGVIDAFEAVRQAAYGSGGLQDLTTGTHLLEGRPNPFTRGTTIRFWMPKGGPIDPSIFDPGGRRVRTILSGTLTAGEHEVAWDGRGQFGDWLGTGLYFASLRANGSAAQMKIVLLK
jgi:subtilisin family serine protease